MARVTTPLLALGMWGLKENPGAGTQDNTTIGTGLNDNWKIIDKALGTEHNTDGTHKDDKIGGNNIKNTIVDGSTLEATATTGSKQFRVKDQGITLAKISKTGATTGKAVTFDGTNIGWGNPNATLPTGYVTRDMVTNLEKPVTSYYLYGDTRVAGTAAGNTVAADVEWAETSTSGVIKVQGNFLARPEDRYLRIVANMKTDNASRIWKLELLVNGSVVQTWTGTNTSYDVANREVNAFYAIGTDGTGFATPSLNSYALRITAVSPSTVNMKNLVVTVTSHNSDAS